MNETSRRWHIRPPFSRRSLHLETRAASRNAGSFGSGRIGSELGGYLTVHLKEMGYANLMLISADGQVLPSQ